MNLAKVIINGQDVLQMNEIEYLAFSSYVLKKS